MYTLILYGKVVRVVYTCIPRGVHQYSGIYGYITARTFPIYVYTIVIQQHKTHDRNTASTQEGMHYITYAVLLHILYFFVYTYFVYGYIPTRINRRTNIVNDGA